MLLSSFYYFKRSVCTKKVAVDGTHGRIKLLVDTNCVVTKKFDYNKVQKERTMSAGGGVKVQKTFIAGCLVAAAKFMLTSMRCHFETDKESRLSLITYTRLP